MRTGLPWMENLVTPLAKSVFVLLGLTGTASETYAVIQEKRFGSRMRTLIFFNDEIDDVMKIVSSHENADLLIVGVSETVKNEVKKQQKRFLGMIVVTLGVRLLGSMFLGKGVLRTGEGVNRAMQDFQW